LGVSLFSFVRSITAAALIDGERDDHLSKTGFERLCQDNGPRRDPVLLDIMKPEMQRRTLSNSLSAEIAPVA
jgi:hypothetical protein